MYAATLSGPAVRRAVEDGLLACISTPRSSYRIPETALVVLDNGVYGKGYPGDEKWLAWVTRHQSIADRVLFVVAPDVVGDARATFERSTPFLPIIRALGFKAAYVIQNGQEDFDPPWDDFDCVFVGGDTDWKLGPEARALIAEAKARGKWVHAGRVNSKRRFAYFELLGCDSVDGTYLAFGPDLNLPDVLHWTNSLTAGIA